jgi:hypothetical protein
MNQSSTDRSISNTGHEVSADDISRRAYEIWESEGRPEGCDFRHWLQAEQELAGRSENSKRSDANTPPRGTTAEARPPTGNRAGTNPPNRDLKRGSNGPFGGEKNGTAAQNQNAARRKPGNSPVL